MTPLPHAPDQPCLYRYSDAYFAHFGRGATRSAEVVLPIVQQMLAVSSVVDFGCGGGNWLAVWQRLGVDDIVGCDGPYLDPSSLAVDSARFVPADLAAPVRLGRSFDLVQCLEVAEHLPAAAAPTLIETLTSHGPIVLFSAASPGQGGEHHVNEQPLDYWRVLFRQRGYWPLDAIRPRIAGAPGVEPWYRYNTMLFVEASHLVRLDPALRRHLIADDAPARAYAPWTVRLGQRFARLLPEPIVTRIAAGVRRLAAGLRR